MRQKAVFRGAALALVALVAVVSAKVYVFIDESYYNRFPEVRRISDGTQLTFDNRWFVDTYIADTRKDGIDAVPIIWPSSNTRRDLWDRLVDGYVNDDLEGAVLIGNLPYALFSDGDEIYPHEAFFMDVANSGSSYGSPPWNETTVNGIPCFDGYTGDGSVEIWTSRVYAESIEESYLAHHDYTMVSGDVHDVYLDLYLDRVHKRMTQKAGVPPRVMCVGMSNTRDLWEIGMEELDLPFVWGIGYPHNTPSNWQSQLQAGPLGNCNGSPSVCNYAGIPNNSTIDDRLDDYGFEWAFLFEHSSPSCHHFGQDAGTHGHFYNTHPAPIDVDRTFADMADDGGLSKPHFFVDFGCSNLQFSEPNCLGLLYAMLHNGLSNIGASMVSTVQSYSVYTETVSNGATLGEAYKACLDGISLEPHRDNARTLLGAGTLKAQPYGEPYSSSQIGRIGVSTEVTSVSMPCFDDVNYNFFTPDEPNVTVTFEATPVGVPDEYLKDFRWYADGEVVDTRVLTRTYTYNDDNPMGSHLCRLLVTEGSRMPAATTVYFNEPELASPNSAHFHVHQIMRPWGEEGAQQLASSWNDDKTEVTLEGAFDDLRTVTNSHGDSYDLEYWTEARIAAPMCFEIETGIDGAYASSSARGAKAGIMIANSGNHTFPQTYFFHLTPNGTLALRMTRKITTEEADTRGIEGGIVQETLKSETGYAVTGTKLKLRRVKRFAEFVVNSGGTESVFHTVQLPPEGNWNSYGRVGLAYTNSEIEEGTPQAGSVTFEDFSMTASRIWAGRDGTYSRHSLITEALAAVAEEGDTIFVNDGVYMAEDVNSGPILVDKSVAFVGRLHQGRTATSKRDQDVWTRSTIRGGLWLEGEGSSVYGLTIDDLILRASNCVVEQCVVGREDGASYMLGVEYAWDCIIRNNSINTGITLSDHTMSCEVLNNLIRNPNGPGILVLECSCRHTCDNVFDLDNIKDGVMYYEQDLGGSIPPEDCINTNTAQTIRTGTGLSKASVSLSEPENVLRNSAVTVDELELYLGGETVSVYRNNFFSPDVSIVNEGATVTWNDNGNVGNYWQTYTGADTDGDGRGDTELPAMGVDNYPLVNPLTVRYVESFEEGSTLADVGYWYSSEPYWELDTSMEALVTTSPGGWGAMSRVCTPELIATRDVSPLTVEWRVMYPTNSGVVSWRENNKTWVSLTDENGGDLYKLMFKPNRETDRYTSHDLELVKVVDGSEVILKRAWTHLLAPPHTWLSFKLVVDKLSGAGGTGTIQLLYDNGDGGGYREFISVVDQTYRSFKHAKFAYKTGTGDLNLKACLGVLNVYRD